MKYLNLIFTGHGQFQTVRCGHLAGLHSNRNSRRADGGARRDAGHGQPVIVGRRFVDDQQALFGR